MAKQNTLKAPVTFSGTGLHSGAECVVVVNPGAPDAGIVIKSGDRAEKLSPSLSEGSRNCNAVRLGPELEILTLEHLLSAVWACGIDNAVLDFSGPEAPGLDGSARQYAEGLRKAGLAEQEADRRVYIPKEPISVGGDKAGVTAFPSADGKFRVTYVLDYKESSRARGTATMEIDPDSFAGEIAPARTFVMREHAAAMQAAGLGKGANPQNTLVLDGDNIVDNEFRVPDECVRHKILDLIGDLSILNRRLGAHVVANKSGHALNIELAKAVRRRMLAEENPAGVIDFKEVTRILPHRYPFLLIDRVLELEEKKRIVAIKNLTFNEQFFQGHFPGQPIMPGVLQIEALAQAGAIMMLGEFAGKGKLAVLMTAEEVKWRRQVIPGDCLYLHAEFVKMRRSVGIVKVWGEVDGDVTTEATIKFAIVDAKPAY